MTVPDRVQKIFRDVFDDNQLVIKRETSAKDIESWDSLSHINIVMAVEKEFGIKFALGELQDLRNVGDMFDVIEKKTQQK
jgi:acyl carrier protein